MKSLRVSTAINASPADVFHVLTDYENYSRWNPWLNVIQGEAVEGKYLILKPRLRTIFIPMKYQYDKVEQSAVLQRRQVGWIHHFIYTERERLIYTKADGSTLYVTRFSFKGPLASISRFMYGRTVYRGIKDETLALKKFCEEHYSFKTPKDQRLAPYHKYTGSKPKTTDIPDLEIALGLA